MKYLKVFIGSSILMSILLWLFVWSGKYWFPRQDPLPGDFPEMNQPIMQFIVDTISCMGMLISLLIFFLLNLTGVQATYLSQWFYFTIFITFPAGTITLVIFLWDLVVRKRGQTT